MGHQITDGERLRYALMQKLDEKGERSVQTKKKNRPIIRGAGVVFNLITGRLYASSFF
jgi:hypothetical protein